MSEKRKFFKIDRQPVIILTLSVMCLLAFLITIPLPRIDGQLVGSDGIRYFVYLPSLVFDKDLDFTNEFTFLLQNQPEKLESVLANPTSKGLPGNLWPIGSALLWLPFYLVGHISAYLLNLAGAKIPLDGLGDYYQAWALTGSIVYGCLGMWLSWKFASRFYDENVALLSTILIVFGGNLVYYMTAEPSMSHSVSFFASSAFFYFWSINLEKSDLTTYAKLGAIVGVMALVRPQDGLFVVLPIIAALFQIMIENKGKIRLSLLKRWLLASFILGVSSILVYIPQLAVWYVLYGGILQSPYVGLAANSLFTSFPSHFMSVLFSSARGLLVWHPIFLLSLSGFWFAYQKKPILSIVFSLGFFIQWYVISGWFNWMQGDSFGGRMFIVCTPIFIFTLGYLLLFLKEHFSFQWILALGGFFLVWNLLLFVEYRFDLVNSPTLPTWYDITIRRLTYIFEKVFQSR